MKWKIAKKKILRESFQVQYVNSKRSPSKKCAKYQRNNIRTFPRMKDTSFQIVTTETHSLLDENRTP